MVLPPAIPTRVPSGRGPPGRSSSGRSRRRGGVAVAALTAAGCTLAPSPGAAWERPVVLSPPTQYVVGPYLAVNGRGDALLTWARGRPPPEAEEWALPPLTLVEASLRPAGTLGWTPAERLSPKDEMVLFPRPGLLPSGRAVVLWSTVRRGLADITESEGVFADGAWSVTSLDMLANEWGRMATAPDGTLAIAGVNSVNWLGDKWELRVRVRAADGAWRESAPIPWPSEVARSIVVAGDGSVLVGSLEQLGKDPRFRTRLVTTSWDPRTGTWDTPQQTTYVRGAAADVRLAVASDGAVVAAIALQRAGGYAVAAASRPPGASFGSPQVLSDTSNGSFVQVAASPTGDVFVVWKGVDGPRMSARRSGGGWSRPEAPPPGACIEGEQEVAAMAVGPSGEVLIVGIAGHESDWYPGLVRAWVRRPDGGWVGPVWLSRALAGSPVAAIDGSGRMHVAWSRHDVRLPTVEATSATLAEAAVDAAPGLAVVSHVRVVSRGRTRTARFHLSRAGPVTVSLRPAVPRENTPTFVTTAMGRRGANAVPIRVREPAGVPRGRWVVSVKHDLGYISGCPVASSPFPIR